MSSGSNVMVRHLGPGLVLMAIWFGVWSSASAQDDEGQGSVGAVADNTEAPARRTVRRTLKRTQVPADTDAQGASGGPAKVSIKRLERVVPAPEPEKTAEHDHDHHDHGDDEQVLAAVDVVDPALAPEPSKPPKEVNPPAPAPKSVGPPKGPFVFLSPVKKVRITSRYGMRRDPKKPRRRRMHKGLDYGGPTGTRVYATGPGKVLRSGNSRGGAGIRVVIEHPNGWVSRYFHLSKVDVKAGTYVKRGDVIGRIGSTGRSTGPHLHFQVEYKGHAVNPEKVLGHSSDKAHRRVSLNKPKKRKKKKKKR